MGQPLKVSFCITCKGRLNHLKQTLPANLNASADYSNAEFVVLDYGSQDGLEDWIRQNYQAEIASGRIRYVKYEPAPYFKMAHAKNMAHRLATGDILCNLDADNFIAAGFADWLNQEFSKNPDTFAKMQGTGALLRKMKTAEKLPRGLRGKIALSRDNFYALNGYDERYIGWGSDDANITRRAAHTRLKKVYFPPSMIGDAIVHDNTTRIENYDPDYKEKSRVLLEAVELTGLGRIMSSNRWKRKIAEIKKARQTANPDGRYGEVEQGAALRDINHNMVELEPYPVVHREKTIGWQEDVLEQRKSEGTLAFHKGAQ